MIRRVPGAPEEIIYRTTDDEHDLPISSTTHSKKSSVVLKSSEENGDMNTDQPVVKAILPKFEIDSSSKEGSKLNHIEGNISFKSVCFSYPTRPHETVLNGMSTEISAGQTVAFVGPR